MAIDEHTKRRLLTFKEKLQTVELLKADARDNVITCSTIVSYAASIAHRLGRDAQTVSVGSIQAVAADIGIGFRPAQATRSLPSAFTRILTLEATLDDVLKRVDELERAFDRATTPEHHANGPGRDV